MPSGGHARSGPQPDPNSLNSAKRGISLTALPAAGHDGEAPVFPLPPVRVYDVWFDDDGRHKVLDEEATEARRDREVELWAWAWRTPQAAAWSLESWRWQTVAMWVRTHGICESADATAADKNSLHRFADQIGLTPAGLKENGWKVAPAELPKAATGTDGKPPTRSSARGRLTVVKPDGD